MKCFRLYFYYLGFSETAEDDLVQVDKVGGGVGEDVNLVFFRGGLLHWGPAFLVRV